MLKLNSSKILIIGIVVMVFLNCKSEKKEIHEQIKKVDTLSVINASDLTNTTNIAILDSFGIAIEGYNATRLGQAVYTGDTATVGTLIKGGASFAKCLTDETYIYDILYAALVFNKIDIVRYVLKNKLYKSINATYSEEAETPLTLACGFKDSSDALEIADTFISLGANVDGAGESGGEQTIFPLLVAVNQNNVRLTKLLIENHANRNIVNENGISLLQIAQQKGFEGIVSLLNKN